MTHVEQMVLEGAAPPGDAVMDDVITPGALATLHDSLASERRLLDDLVGVLRRQRDAVAGNDVVAVDDTMFATHRILLTLGEARRRRRRILQLMQLPEALPVGDLVPTLGAQATPALRELCDALPRIAAVIAREVATNRQLLRGALAAGDELVRALAGLPADDAGALLSRDARLPGGALVDRTI